MDAAALCQFHKLRRQLPAKDRMSILTKAVAIVDGPRQENYGHPLDNWTLTANLVNALFADKLKEPFTADDLMLFMNQVKVARERHKPSEDNKMDIAGYARCKEMIEQERERRRDTMHCCGRTPEEGHAEQCFTGKMLNHALSPLQR